MLYDVITLMGAYIMYTFDPTYHTHQHKGFVVSFL